MSHVRGRDQTHADHTAIGGLGSVKIVLARSKMPDRPKVHLVHDVDYSEAQALTTNAASFKWIPHSVMSADSIKNSLSPCSASDCLGSDDATCPSGCGCLQGQCY